MTFTAFDPSTDSAGFRTALGNFATGVTIITTDSPLGPVAIAANSFSSVSLDPPLVLWSAAKGSRRFEHFAGSRRFAVNILANDQLDICNAVAHSKTALNGFETTNSHCGMPLIDGALATFECSLEATHDAGDHAIIVGLVTRAQHRNGAPLVFSAGQYGGFNPS